MTKFDTVQFEVGTSMTLGDFTYTVVKKTYHFTTFEITEGEKFVRRFRRKEKFDARDNGWLEMATFTKSVEYGATLYACEFE